MARRTSSSSFTEPGPSQAAEPPLIGALLRMSYETVRTRMLARLHEEGFTDLQPAHLNVFQYPGPDGATPSELAARIGISKQALNYLLGELERLGYLERRPHPDDLRSKRIAVTRRGGDAIRVIRGAVEEVESEWAGQLGRKRFEQLRGLLSDVNRSL